VGPRYGAKTLMMYYKHTNKNTCQSTCLHKFDVLNVSAVMQDPF